MTANEKLEKQTNGGVSEENVKEKENSQEKILSLKEKLNVQCLRIVLESTTST